MEVQILSRKFVKPSTPTPNHHRTHKLSFFDQLPPPAHIPLLFFYPSDGISTTNEKLERLEKSLSDTLTLFYPQSGRFIKEDLLVDCSDQGAEFFEAKVNLPLHEFLSLGPKKLGFLDRFVPWDIGLSFLPTTPMVAIQVTFFECGGLVICVHASHVIADGFTASAFIHGWATASQTGIGEVVRPSFDVFSLFPSRDNISAEIIDQPLPNLTDGVKVVTKIFVFDAAKIAELKAKLGGSGEERKPGRVEVVISALWKALILASRARNDGKLRSSFLSLTINLRGRTALRTSENINGNFFMLTPTEFKPQQNTTDQPSHNHLLGLLRESVQTTLSIFGKLSNGDEIASAVTNHLNKVRISAMDEKVDVHHFTSMCRFPLYEVDFGWGKPCLVSNTCPPLEVVVLMDTACGTGIEAWVSLKEPCMLEFEKDPDILGLINSSCSPCGKYVQ